jgi:hypothetical protein
MDDAARTQFWLAVVATLIAAGFGWMLRSIEWNPQAPFDVLGVLWILTNIPGVILWGVFLGLLLLALRAWGVFFRRLWQS